MANRGTGTGGRDDAAHRATKAERKEQARLEREKIQQQMRARHRNRNIGLTLMALAVVVVVVAVFVMQPGKGKSGDLSTPKDLLAQAKDAAKTAGCDAPSNVGPYNPASADRTHVGGDPQYPTMPPLSTYPSTPPASGPHNPTTLPAGVYNTPPPVDESIHSMEHAGAIIWYAPDAPSTVIDQIKTFYQQSANVGQSKVIIAPYDYKDQGTAGQLPAGVQMALVAWHFVQTCNQPNLAVAFNFTAQYSNAYDPSLYIGQAPEPNNTM